MPESRDLNNASSSLVDVACTHCRHRKIRCGRERPKCSNCERDNAECDYQVPGKRVNHMKLLCNNVEAIDDRLLGIESQLCCILSGMRRDPSSSWRSVGVQSSTAPSSSSSTSSEGNDSDYGESTDRYRGPLSLEDLCQDLKDQMRSSVECEALIVEHDDQGASVEDLTQQLCHMAIANQIVSHQQANDAPQLPSKDHIMKAQSQFFRRTDYKTDIFVPENFLANLDRIYNTRPPYCPADEAWVVCFKAIVLLVLGSELVDSSTDTVLGWLAGSFLLPGGAPLVNSRLLTAPLLINAQALILLSALAQQHESQAWSDMLLAHACTLAKTMRLHRSDAMPLEMTAKERQERLKVFRSLYIRDKEVATSRGTVSWLTEANLNIISETNEAEQMAHASRLELALIQNRIYRLAHGSKPPKRFSKKLQVSLARIEDDLAKFALSHRLFDPPTHGGSENVALQLAFLSTRIGALLDSASYVHARQAILDSRASCIALLLAFSPADPDLLRRFEKLVSANRTAYQFSAVETVSTGAEESSSQQKEPKRSRSISLLSILHSFPPAAIFLLVKKIISPPQQQTRDANLEDDLDLIQKVYACYVSNAPIMAAGSYGQMLLSAYRVILQLLRLVKNGPQPTPIPATVTPASQFNAEASTLMECSDSTKSVISATHNTDIDMATFPAWPTPTSTQAASSWDSWQEAMNGGANPDMSSLLLSTQPAGSSCLFNDFNLPGPQQNMSWNSPFQDEKTGREKRRRTDDGRESQLDHNNNAQPAQGLIDEFLLSPEALQSLFPFGNI